MSSTSYVRSYPFDAKVEEENFDKNRRVVVADGQNVWHQHGPYGCLSLFQCGFSLKSGAEVRYTFHPNGAPSYSITSYGGDLEFMALRLAPLDLHEPVKALFAWAREVAPYSFPPSGS